MSTLLERQREYTGWLENGFPELGLKGLPLVSACAFTGNGSQENLVRPVTTGPKDHGSDGILQWRLDRLDGPRGLKGWSKERGLPWNTIKTQAAFTLWELYSDPRYDDLARDLLAGKKPIEALTEDICWIFERPAKSAAHLDKRISHAKSVYLILSKERGAPPNEPVSDTAKAGGVVAGGALITAGGQNAVAGGDTWMSAISIGAGIIAAVAPWAIEKLKKPPAPTAEEPELPELDDDAPIEPTEIIASLTAALDAAVAHEQACLAELEKARAATNEERRKVSDRIELMRAAVAASELSRASAALPAAAQPMPAAIPATIGELHERLENSRV
jgi:hypothetical protein